MSISLPDKRTAAIEYGMALAKEILSEKIDLIKGAQHLIDTIHRYDFFSGSKKYCYDSIGFESVYGAFYNYDDLINARHTRDVSKTYEELLIEVKAKLSEELGHWVEKYKDGA